MTTPFSNALIASLDEDKKPDFQKYHKHKIFIINMNGWRKLSENNTPDWFFALLSSEGKVYLFLIFRIFYLLHPTEIDLCQTQ